MLENERVYEPIPAANVKHRMPVRDQLGEKFGQHSNAAGMDCAVVRHSDGLADPVQRTHSAAVQSQHAAQKAVQYDANPQRDERGSGDD